MKIKPSLPMLLCLMVMLVSIGIVWDAGFGAEDGNGLAAESASGSASAGKIEEAVFPRDKVVDVKITIDEDDFQDMLDNASAEEMKTASVDYNGIHLDNVGIRTKGNLSLRSVVNSDSDRYSFKLSFDEYLSNQTLLGIGKINLNNNYSDATYMREFLTYELAEQMGLPTPQFSYVNVYVNGEPWGFYLAVEQVGDAYLERHFGNAYGALYKAEFGGGAGPGGNRGGGASGGGDLVWKDDDPASYTALVQKSKSSSGDMLIRMLDELNNGNEYESVLDVEGALKYIALNAVTANMDSYIGSNQQNYYLYEDDGIFSVLPWDYNMAFGGMGGGGSTILIDEPTQGAVAERPLVAKLLAVDEYKEMYHDIVRGMVEGYLADETFAERVREIARMISADVKADPRPFYTYEQFESAVPQLISFTSGVVDNVASQLDGKSPSSGDGSGSGGGMGGPGEGFGGRMQGEDMNGQAPQGGQMPNGQMPDGQMPEGQNGQGGGFGGGGGGPGGIGGMGGGPGGMGRPDGGFGGPVGFGGELVPQNEGSARELLATVAALIVLGAASLFVASYKRKRL